MATMLYYYDKEFLEEDGESYYRLRKYNNPDFLERIVAILPMQIPHLSMH